MLFLIFILFGGIAQFIDGTIGMGYGVSASRLLISLGIYPAIASASVHTAEIFTTFASGSFHLKFGNVRQDLVKFLSIPGILGGILGAYLCVKMPPLPLKLVVNIILLIMGMIILYRFTCKRLIQFKIEQPSPKFLIPLGFFAAFIDALGGGGWGPIATPALVLNKVEPSKAIGSVNLAEFFVTVAEVITFFILLGRERFRGEIVLALIIGGVITAPLAALTCKRLPHKILGQIVGIALIILSAYSLLKIFLLKNGCVPR